VLKTNPLIESCPVKDLVFPMANTQIHYHDVPCAVVGHTIENGETVLIVCECQCKGGIGSKMTVRLNGNDVVNLVPVYRQSLPI